MSVWPRVLWGVMALGVLAGCATGAPRGVLRGGYRQRSPCP